MYNDSAWFGGDRHRGGIGEAGSPETGDPSTTNLYLGNLSPRLTEKELMELFGKYGPLVSCKFLCTSLDVGQFQGFFKTLGLKFQ